MDKQHFDLKRLTIAITPGTWLGLKRHSQGFPMVQLIRAILAEWVAARDNEAQK